MYCPQCGKQVSEDLKYCNGCGERLTRESVDQDDTPGQMLSSILRTLFAIVVFGLGILVGLVAVLLGNEVRPDAVFWLGLAYLATIFGICFTLIRQVPKLIDAKLKAWNNTVDIPPVLRLSPQTTGQLDEYREPAMSVTDHTTKTLDKIPARDR